MEKSNGQTKCLVCKGTKFKTVQSKIILLNATVRENKHPAEVIECRHCGTSYSKGIMTLQQANRNVKILQKKFLGLFKLREMLYVRRPGEDYFRRVGAIQITKQLKEAL